MCPRQADEPGRRYHDEDQSNDGRRALHVFTLFMSEAGVLAPLGAVAVAGLLLRRAPRVHTKAAGTMARAASGP